MENNKINIAEILKDCPKGTKLYSPIFGNVSFEKLIDNVVYPIHVVGKNSRQIYFSKDGRYIADESCSDAECLLFPSHRLRDWSKFFKPGDVVIDSFNGCGVLVEEWGDDSYTSFKASVFQFKKRGFVKSEKWGISIDDFVKASDKQREKFLVDMEKFFGGKYNPETLSAEPVNSKCPFRPFDKVLARDTDEQTWCANYFSHYKKDPDYPYVCINGSYRYCIPYECNEHLLGTTDTYTEGGSK